MPAQAAQLGVPATAAGPMPVAVLPAAREAPNAVIAQAPVLLPPLGGASPKGLQEAEAVAGTPAAALVGSPIQHAFGQAPGPAMSPADAPTPAALHAPAGQPAPATGEGLVPAPEQAKPQFHWWGQAAPAAAPGPQAESRAAAATPSHTASTVAAIPGAGSPTLSGANTAAASPSAGSTSMFGAPAMAPGAINSSSGHMHEAGQLPQQPQGAVARSAASSAAVDPGPIVGGVLGGLIAVCSSECPSRRSCQNRV